MRKWHDFLEIAQHNELKSSKKVFFEKEIENCKIDEEERKFQEMQKKMVIERANKVLWFYLKDKTQLIFHSKLLLADVLKEKREYQK